MTLARRDGAHHGDNDQMATRIDFIAWHSMRPLSDREIEQRIAAAEAFYPHAFHSRHVKIGANRHTGLIVWMPQIRNLAVLAGPAGDALAYASHLPFGISQHTDVTGKVTPAEVLALHEKIRGEPESVTTLGAPLNLVHLAADGGLHLNNDYRGLAEVFHHGGETGLHVWSNRLSMPLLFALESPKESVHAAQLRAIFFYTPHAHTPFANVDRVAGGTTVFAGDWPAEPLVTQRKLMLEMLGAAYAEQGAPVDYALCAESVARMLGEIGLFWSGPMRSGLTGGRDSRAVLAFLIASGIEDKVRLATTKILKQDYQVAAQLVATCQREGHPVSWDLVERSSSSYSASNRDAAWDDFPAARAATQTLTAAVKGMADWVRGRTPDNAGHGYRYTDNALLDRMVFQFHRLDGQTMPIGYYTAPAREQPDHNAPLTLGGHSGEILRASQYTSESLPGGAEAWIAKRSRNLFRSSKSWVGIVDRKAPFVGVAQRRAKQAWMQYIDDARAAGVGGFLALDYINVAGKQSRRVDVPKQLRLVCPLSHPMLLAESYKLSPEERLANTFPRKLIEAAAPYLLEAPFSFELPKEQADIRLDMTGKPQFWDRDAVAGFAEIIAEPERWADTFDEASIQAEFGARPEPELNAYQRDTIGGLLLWRAAQGAYASVLSKHVARHRQKLAVAA